MNIRVSIPKLSVLLVTAGLSTGVSNLQAAEGKPFQQLQAQVDELRALLREKCPDDSENPTFENIRVEETIFFGTGECTLGVDPNLTGLVERDPAGFRLLGANDRGCRLLFGPTDLCTVQVDPTGPAGLLLTDPNGIRILNPLREGPTRLLFGPTDDCSIGIIPNLPGLTESDPFGFRLLGPNGEGCRLIFGPTMDCTIEVAPQGPKGLLLRDPNGIRIINPNPEAMPTIVFGPTDDCTIRASADPKFPGIIITDPWQLTVDSPTLFVEGRVVAEEFVSRSSRSLKKNIRPIEKALDKINRLQGVSFEWKGTEGRQAELGFIAEDVAQVLPELVVTQDRDQSHPGVKYPNMVAVAVEGIKEQQQQIDSLRQENTSLKETLSAMQEQLARMAKQVDSLTVAP